MNIFSGFRYRLVILNTVIVICIYSLVSFFIYSSMKNRLQQAEFEKLDEHLNVVSTVVYKSGGDYNDWFHLGNEKPFLIMEDWAYSYCTSAWTKLDFPKQLNQKTFDELGLSKRNARQRSFLLKYKSVRTGIDTMHNFQVIAAQENTNVTENIINLRGYLLNGGWVVLILAFSGSFFLAGHALKPIKMMRQKAQKITALSLSERLPVLNPRDEIGQLTNVFNNLLERLEQAFEHLKQFTADASHELRTPLTSIRSTGQVALKNARESAEFKDAIASMLEDIDHLTHLVSNLLLLTRHDSAKPKIEFSEINLVDQIKYTIEQLRILAEEKNIDINFQHPEIITHTVNIEGFQQALSNVLYNAIIYTPVTGHIDIEITKDKSGSIQIDIEDNGPGIAPQFRDKVFERFFRIDKSRSHAQGGSGLGLAIARQGIEINKGKIQFTEGKGTGAHCTIIFPAKQHLQ